MTTDNITKFFPNYIVPGYNESKLIDKISTFIAAAHTWAQTYIAPSSFIETHEELQDIYNDIIAARALYLAAPALDVTMHPNGLAVVNTDALAPASAERSKEFRNALDRQLLDHIDAFLQHVTTSENIFPEYADTTPAKQIWLNTIFYDCNDLIAYTAIPYSWDSLINTITKIQLREQEIAEKFISTELLKRFRSQKGPAGYITQTEILLTRELKIIISRYLNTESDITFNDMRRIVNTLRINQTIFPEWHTSETAKLFDPPVFRNQKHSGGYFF